MVYSEHTPVEQKWHKNHKNDQWRLLDPKTKNVQHSDPNCTYKFFQFSLTFFLIRYGALWDIFNAAMNATLGCDSTQVSALFFLAYANGELFMFAIESQCIPVVLGGVSNFYEPCLIAKE